MLLPFQQAEQLQNQMEQDYYIGYGYADMYCIVSYAVPCFVWTPSSKRAFLFARSTIRDKIIPHFVSWFTGEAAQEEDFELEDEEDEVNKDDDHSASCRPIRVIQLQHLRASPTG
jgi:hypothetical protein